MLVELLQSGFSFFRHVKGIIVSPYETYRDIEKRGRTGELLYIGLLVGLYFFFSSIVKTASFHPLLLSRVAFVLFVAALSGFGLMVSLFVVVGRSLGTKASIERLSLLWGYTLIPTVVWFLFTSFICTHSAATNDGVYRCVAKCCISCGISDDFLVEIDALIFDLAVWSQA